jgi:hypothetical protein
MVGLWAVSARTLENAGFGTDASITDVYPKRINAPKPPQLILSFWHDPYVAPPQSGATINLTMKSATPRHLEVTYEGHADLSFQVVKYEDTQTPGESSSPKLSALLFRVSSISD